MRMAVSDLTWEDDIDAHALCRRGWKIAVIAKRVACHP